MTPAIREMVSYFPEIATEFQWFDYTEMFKTIGDELHKSFIPKNLDQPFPFPKIALASHDGEDAFLIFLSSDQEIKTVMVFADPRDPNGKRFMYQYRFNEKGQWMVKTDFKGHQKKQKSFEKLIPFTAKYIAAFLNILDMEPVKSYSPIERINVGEKNPKDKTPQYDWKTIVLKPPKPKGEDKGGTHASPRWHERRGHWRTTKSQQRIWVKNCEVGDNKLGAVFHDYKLKVNA